MNTNQVTEPRHVAIIRAAETSRTELAETEPIAPVPANFAVVDVKSANWVLRRIMEARAYAEAVQQWAEAEAERAKREEEFFLLHFGNGLQAVLEEEIEKQKGRRKSVKLPAGTMGYRAEPQRLRVENEAAAIEWAHRHCPDAVRVTERISRTAINEHHTASGEVPEGCTIQPAGERFYIR
jgi:hypothetical protein